MAQANKQLVREAKAILKSSKELTLTDELSLWHNWMVHAGQDCPGGCHQPAIQERARIFMSLDRNP